MLSVRELWWLYAAIVLCSLLMAATTLLVPFVLKAAIDYITLVVNGQASGVAPVIWLAALLLALDLLNTLFTNVGGYIGDVMATRLRAILSARYFEKLLSLPQRYYDNELTGKIINRLSRSITEVTNFLNSFANGFFQMLVTVVAVLIITAVYSWPLAVMLAVMYPVYVWLTAKTSAKWQGFEQEKNTEYDIAGGRFAEVVGQIRVVKSFRQERRELDEFRQRYSKTVAITKSQSRFWHQMDVLRRVSLNLVFFGVFSVIFVQTAEGVFTLGVMVLLIQLVGMARTPVLSMSYMIDFAQRAVAGSKDYFAVMEESPEAQSGALREVGQGAATTTDAVIAPETLAGSEPQPSAQIDKLPIVFEGVSFSYSDEESLLRDISFEIPAGERVAFVAESGGGKSTLMSLLLRLYTPTAGRIRIGETDIAALPLGALRRQVGVVFQEPALFSGTIRENIAYARPEATDAQVEAAAKSANVHEFVSKFAQGYSTEIGERGLKLSGGQKQRIAIARALLKDAPILVLDEATSALDSKSEQLVQDGLELLMHERTTFIIAHRLSTISAVDRIITLRNGRVDENGSPKELAQSGGIYAELLALQASATKRDKKRLRSFDIQL
nr:ABC transporter ATP-binding protein [Lysinibacter cavernae]